MTAYYNENDAYAAQWLRNLIADGFVAHGDVDTRSIVDVRPDDVRGYTQCHWFAGIGGWSVALRLAGWPDDRPAWTGSCPCQPFSNAGKRRGFADERHLWPIWRELIRERRPAVVFGEQVARAPEWVRLMRGNLEAMEYAVGILPFEAASAGAYHLRDRMWFVAHPEGERWQQRRAEHEDHQRVLAAAGGCGMGDASGARLPFPKFEILRRTWWRQEGRAAAEPSCAGGAVAHAEEQRRPDRDGGAVQGRIERTWQAEQPQRCGGSPVADTDGGRRQPGDRAIEGTRHRSAVASDGGKLDWYISIIDGKARPAKSGIQLLADGVCKRVPKLRALGNAIVPQAAAQFIAAYMEVEHERARA